MALCHRCRQESAMITEISLLIAVAALLVCATSALVISFVAGGLAAFFAIPFILVLLIMAILLGG
jgi:F0F1-type ATP synthase assembly protein I